MISKYLAKGSSSGHIYVIDGRAIHLELDGSIVVCEPTHLANGFYDFEEKRADQTVEKFLTAIFDQNVSFIEGKMTLREYLKIVVVGYIPLATFQEIHDIPNITKGLAEGLSKANETMTFAKVGNRCEFVCFGTRPLISKFLDSSVESYVSVSPSDFYYATNYKGKVLFDIKANALMVRGENGNCAMILDTDVELLAKYRVGENQTTLENEESVGATSDG